MSDEKLEAVWMMVLVLASDGTTRAVGIPPGKVKELIDYVSGLFEGDILVSENTFTITKDKKAEQS